MSVPYDLVGVWIVTSNREVVHNLIWEWAYCMICWRLTLTRDREVVHNSIWEWAYCMICFVEANPYQGSRRCPFSIFPLFITISIQAWQRKEWIPIPSCFVGAQKNKLWAWIFLWSFQNLILSSHTGRNIVANGPTIVRRNGCYFTFRVDSTVTESFDKFWKSGFIWGNKDSVRNLCLRGWLFNNGWSNDRRRSSRRWIDRRRTKRTWWWRTDRSKRRVPDRLRNDRRTNR